MSDNATSKSTSKLQSKIAARIPGVLLSAAVAAVSWYLSPHIPHTGKVMLSILLGMVVGNIVQPGEKLGGGVGYCSKSVLSLAIAMLGFSLQWSAALAMGWPVVVTIVCAVAVGIASAALAGRLLGYRRDFALLMGVGNSICGSSAIAAASGVLKSESEEIALSLGVVNLLGTVGMLLLPPVCLAMSLGDSASSVLIGGSLQAVGQVAAAGSTLGEHIAVSATSVKMLRILMLIPVIVFLSLLMQKSASADGESGQGASKKTNIAKMVPIYLWGFLGCSVAAAVIGSDSAIITQLKLIAKILLCVAMAAVGMKIHIGSLLRHAPKAILLGIISMAAQLGIVLLLIKCLPGI